MYVVKVVSNDGKKVRRKDPFTDREKEELQVDQLVHFFIVCAVLLSLVIVLKEYVCFGFAGSNRCG